jgi:hypothetical protein
MNNAQFAENLEKQLHDDIVKEPDTDTTFIYNLVSLCYLQVHLVVILLIAYGSLQSYLLKMVTLVNNQVCKIQVKKNINKLLKKT